MEEFITTLTQQVRCVKAREGIAREIEDHIIDQADYYEEHGMEHDEAVKEAVRQMGDPVSIGVELDRIHRPGMDWLTLLLIVFCSVGGLFVQYVAGGLNAEPDLLLRQSLITLLGLAVMVAIYFMDYSFVGKYGVLLYAGFSVLLCIYGVAGPSVNGQKQALKMLLYLLVPIYAGVLYRYRRVGYAGIFKCIAFQFPALFLAKTLIPSLSVAFNLSIIMNGMLAMAVMKNWFLVNKKKTITTMFSVFVAFPLLLTLFMYHFVMFDYQKARLEAFIHPTEYKMGAGYIYYWIREGMLQTNLFEGTGSLDGLIPGHMDYLLTQLIYGYGLFFGVIVIALAVLFFIRILRISFRQKNQLGFMIGLGCSLVFVVQGSEYIAMNLGIFPGTSAYLPFLSYGGAVTIVFYVLLGFLLSVYRYRNVLKDAPLPHEKGYKPMWRLSLRFEKR